MAGGAAQMTSDGAAAIGATADERHEVNVFGI